MVAIAAVAAVVGSYLALGGASYEPTAVADPCVTREWRDPGDLEAVLEQVALSAFDGAACELGVSREELVLALRDEESLDAFAAEHGVDRGDAERAFEDGIDRALAEAEEAGALSGLTAALVARAVDAVPPWLLLEALESLGGLFSP
jgi:AcrR family transcriptional regulator